MKRLARWLLALSLARRAQRRREERSRRRDDRASKGPESRVALGSSRAELAVALLLLAAGGCGAVFAVLIAVNDDTQLLGLALGGALIALSTAAVLAARRAVPQETAVEERPQLGGDEDEVRAVDGAFRAAGDGVSRRRLLTGAAGVAGVGLGAALAAPISALGPNVSQRIDDTPWHAGRAVVDEDGNPVLADDVAPGTLVTAFPQGADRRNLGSPIVLVRLRPDQLHLPSGRDDWAPEGIVAYSKICTHAGCAIALYRKPTYPAAQPRPALVCPCHYSTFDPARGASVIFGPAGRALPQLPLRIAADRRLVAGGGFSGSVGPAWLNVERS